MDIIWDHGITFTNYMAGAVTFVILFWQVVALRSRKLYSWAIALAAGLTAVRLLAVIADESFSLQTQFVFAIDLLFYASWYAVIFGLIHGLSGSSVLRGLLLGCVSLLGVLVWLAYSRDQAKLFNPVAYSDELVVWANLILAIVGVILLEQLYRNVRPQTSHTIQLLCLGVGGMFAYDLYLFTQILVLHDLPLTSWNARGVIYVVCCVLLIVTIAQKEENPRVSLSRNVVFYSTSMIIAGSLVLFMTALSYFVLPYSQDWGATLQQVVTFVAILGLIMVSVVPRWRSAARVFINKHFFRHKYDYRTEWLTLIDILSRPLEQDDLEQRAIEVMLSIFHCSGGVLWLHKNDFYSPVAVQGMPMPSAANEPDDSQFIELLGAREWVFETIERRFPEDRAIPDWANTIDSLWIVVPLKNEDRLIGFMGLQNSSGARALSWEDLDLLKTVGRQLGSYIARHQAAEALALARQFDAFNQLTAFIMHDLKNLIAQQSLVVANWQKHKDNPEFMEDAINTIGNSVRRMNHLLNRIQRKGSSSSTRNIALATVLADVVDKTRSRQPVPVLDVIDDGQRVRADPDTLVMVLSHLVVNAQDASAADDSIAMRLSREGHSAVIELQDSGCGMSESFIKHRLFQPFETTKRGKGMGIGVYQAREYVQSIGGKLSVSSAPEQGSTFRIVIPLVAVEDAAA